MRWWGRSRTRREEDFEEAIKLWRRHEPVFEIGEDVVYIHECLPCKVTGYRWISDPDAGIPPIVYMYELDVGLSAGRHQVKKYPSHLMEAIRKMRK